jgi:PAS domain S-box-containing protein
MQQNPSTFSDPLLGQLGLLTICQSVPSGMAILDPHLNYIFINQTLADFNGASIAAHIGHGVKDVLPEFYPQLAPMLHHVLRTGEGLENFEISGPTPSVPDQISHWSASYLPIKNAQQQVIGIGVLAVNKTAEWEAQRIKAESEDLLRRVLDNLFAFVGILDLTGVLVDANLPPIQAAGLDREQVLGKKFWHCDWWNYDAAIAQQLEQAFQQALSGQIQRYDVVVRMIHDSRMTIDFMLAPLYNKQGRLTHVIASGIDISARTASETRLRHSELLFRGVFDNVADALLAVDQQGSIQLANSSAIRHFGYSEADLVQLTLPSLIPQLPWAQIRRQLTEQLAPIWTSPHDLYGVQKNGQLFPVLLSVTLLETKEPARLLVTIADISGEKQTQQRLIDMICEKSALLEERTSLLNEIHHRVKNNLQIISSLLALQSRHLPTELRPVLMQCKLRVRAMALIHQLLYEQTNYAVIKLGPYLQELCQLIRQTLLQDQHSISFDFSELDNNIAVNLTVAMPCGLLANELIMNAIKHAFVARDKGVIKVGLGIQHGICVLSIADNGVGLPEDVKLGEHQSLGFQLIPGFVSQLQGKIDIERLPSGGTRFQVSFRYEH